MYIVSVYILLLCVGSGVKIDKTPLGIPAKKTVMSLVNLMAILLKSINLESLLLF